MITFKKNILILILLVSFANDVSIAQPVVSLTRSGGPCAGDTLTALSNLPISRIIWKLNGAPIDTATKHLLNYAISLPIDSTYNDTPAGPQGISWVWTIQGISIDTSNNIFISFLATPIANPSIPTPPPLPPHFYSIWKYPIGSANGIKLLSTNNDPNGLDYIGSIFVDKNDTVYFAAFTPFNDGIMKLAPGDTVGTYVAGGNSFGQAANQINFPGGVFVDKNRNIYVTDEYNERVQKWMPGATSGFIVAGGNGFGFADSQLNNPQGYL